MKLILYFPSSKYFRPRNVIGITFQPFMRYASYCACILLYIAYIFYTIWVPWLYVLDTLLMSQLLLV